MKNYRFEISLHTGTYTYSTRLPVVSARQWFRIRIRWDPEHSEQVRSVCGTLFRIRLHLVRVPRSVPITVAGETGGGGPGGNPHDPDYIL